MIQVLGQQTSVYVSYQIQGRNNTSTGISRIMTQVIFINIIWQGIPCIWGIETDLIQMEGQYKINTGIQMQEIFIMQQAQLITQLFGKEEIKSEQYQIQMTNQIGLQNQQDSQDQLVTITAWEQQNQSQYQQVTLPWRSGNSQGAGQKYFQQSAQTTGCLQMGISLIYSETGTTNMDIQSSMVPYQTSPTGITKEQKIGQQLIGVTQVFKQAGAPFHNWAPDLYDSISTPVVVWIAIQPKQGIQQLMYNQAPILLLFPEFFIVIGVISQIVGSIALGAQWKIKRFIAYSAISHIGFIQIAYISISPTAYIYYIIIYMQTSLLLFTIIQAFDSLYSERVRTGLAIKEQTGIQKISPFQGIAFGIAQFSLAGIPPLAGFFAKQLVLEAVLTSPSGINLAQIMIQTSTISTANYLSVTKGIQQDQPISRSNFILECPTVHSYIISSLSVQIQFFFIKPSEFISQFVLFY